jgi:hypothetical protein
MKNPNLEIVHVPRSLARIDAVPLYRLEFKEESGDSYIKDFRTTVAHADLSALIDYWILSLPKINYLAKEPSVYSQIDRGLMASYRRVVGLPDFRPTKIENLVFSPASPLCIAVQARSRERNEFVLVKVVAFQEGTALCEARYKGHWLEIELDRSSLDRADLREGDTFEWIPNEQGVVKDQDVRSHPRREDVGERERTEKAFDDLAAKVRKTIV